MLMKTKDGADQTVRFCGMICSIFACRRSRRRKHPPRLKRRPPYRVSPKRQSPQPHQFLRSNSSSE